jgi:hypothetical protein
MPDEEDCKRIAAFSVKEAYKEIMEKEKKEEIPY